MDCPKCEGQLETKRHEGVRIDRCDTCYGILVENYMLDEMKVAFMSETFLDVGSAEIGKKTNKVEEIQCPVCKVAMDKTVDPDQTHIWLETCPKCFRTFLDAGEFTDLKYDTLSDKFKALFQPKRKID